jgi:hypothetical protein
VTLNQAAVSDRVGEATILAADASNVGGTSLRQAPSDTGLKYFVRTVTLDEYVFGSPLINRLGKIVIKIDIEGAELLALRGATELLKRKPVLILEAIDNLQRGFGGSLEELSAFLESAGYKLQSLTETGPAAYTRACPNMLALPSSHR